MRALLGYRATLLADHCGLLSFVVTRHAEFREIETQAPCDSKQGTLPCSAGRIALLRNRYDFAGEIKESPQRVS